jgi:hypothetical protein
MAIDRLVVWRQEIVVVYYIENKWKNKCQVSSCMATGSADHVAGAASRWRGYSAISWLG